MDVPKRIEALQKELDELKAMYTGSGSHDTPSNFKDEGEYARMRGGTDFDKSSKRKMAAAMIKRKMAKD